MDTGSFYYIASQYKFWIQKSGWWAGINEEQTSGNGQTLWRRGVKLNKLELGPMGENGAINLFIVVRKNMTYSKLFQRRVWTELLLITRLLVKSKSQMKVIFVRQPKEVFVFIYIDNDIK